MSTESKQPMVFTLQCFYSIDMVSTLNAEQARYFLSADDENGDPVNMLTLQGAFDDDEEEVFVERSSWTFEYDYPLGETFTFTHENVGTVFEYNDGTMHRRVSVGDLLLIAAQDYVKMYSTTKALEGDERNDSVVINAQFPEDKERNPYGIRMHDIEDLVFESIEIDVTNGRVTFGIGS